MALTRNRLYIPSWNLFIIGLYSFPHFVTSATDDFWKQCGKLRNCYWWAPFPTCRHFLVPRQQTTFENRWQKEQLLEMNNFPFFHNVFNSFPWLIFHFNGVYHIFSICFRSRLLQICCMLERVKLYSIFLPSFTEFFAIFA